MTRERTACVRNQKTISLPQGDREQELEPNNIIRSERVETNNFQCVATNLVKYLVKRYLLTARRYKLNDNS